MQPTDREAFDARMAVLCAGFGVPATAERCEAYWTGLQHMPLSTFIRLVETSLGEGGPEKLPTTGALWKLHHQTKAVRVESRAKEQSPAHPPVDWLTGIGQSALWHFLVDPRRGSPSAASLLAMEAAMDKLIGSYRMLMVEEEIGEAEIAAAMTKRFSELYEPMPADELERARECFRRTGRAFQPTRQEAA